MQSSEFFGHALAFSLAMSGPATARLKNTGELAHAARKNNFVFFFGLVDVIASFLAIVYFSWAYLGWIHLLTFGITYLTLADWIGRSDNRSKVWLVWTASGVGIICFELLLWKPTLLSW